MNVVELLNKDKSQKNFSFEVLPPLKGYGTSYLFSTIESLKEFNPLFINITTHHCEYVYKELDNGQFKRQSIRRRPGTVAIAAAIQDKFNLPVIPHIICSGATVEDIEYELIDLQFLGISNVLLLRGDKARDEKTFNPVKNGHAHTTDLILQVNNFNEGRFSDGSTMRHPGNKFHFGVAAYSEKHEEAPNIEMDMIYLKMKQDMGADYAVTQLFYDNSIFFNFLRRARDMGIAIPIVPGIKPLAKLSQITVVPKTFHCDLPQELAVEAMKCKTDNEAKALGIEWTTQQCKELYAAGINNIHFYTVSAVDSVRQVASRLL